MVEVDGEFYELGYILPGQRIGSSAWFTKLKGYLEKYRFAIENELSALFSRLPDKDRFGEIILSHDDDMELYALK